MGRKYGGKRRNCSSNLSFSHSVFKRLVLQTSKNQGLFGEGLINRHIKILQIFTKMSKHCLIILDFASFEQFIFFYRMTGKCSCNQAEKLSSVNNCYRPTPCIGVLHSYLWDRGEKKDM